MTKDAVKHVAVIVAGGIGVALLLHYYKSDLNVENDSVVMPDTYPSVMQNVPADNTLAAREKANLDYNVPSNRLIVDTANKGCGCKCEGEGSSSVHIDLPQFNLPTFDYQPLPTAPSGSSSDPIAFNSIHSAGAPTHQSLAQATAAAILAAEKAGIKDAATLKAIMRQVIYDHYGF